MFNRSRIARFPLVILCALWGMSSLGWANEPRIAVSSSSLSLPFLVAKEKNYFVKHKVSPELVECLGGNKCMKELAEGRADMAIASELPFMLSAFHGTPISLISTFNTNKDDKKLVVRKIVVKGGINGLVGKRIGYVEKAPSHYYINLFFLYNGIDPRTNVPITLSSDALAAALIKGEVDAKSVWASWGQIALAQRGHYDVDVCLLDVQVPEMDGMETCEYIRVPMGLKELPILTLTLSVLPTD